MKKLTKNLIGVLVLALASTGLKAQNTTASRVGPEGVVYSAGLESGFTTGNTRYTHQWFLGGSLEVDVPVTKRIDFNVNAGYENFFGKSNVNNSGASAPDMHVLPVMVGLRTFIFPVLYLQGDQGVGFLLNKNDLKYNRSAAFLYTQQVGVLIPLDGQNYLDAGIRYEGTAKFSAGDNYSKLNTLSLHVAYAFGRK